DFYLVRTRAPVSNPPSEFKDPVLLLHGRMQVRFAYRDANGQFVDSWNKRPDLPTAVAVQVIGAAGPIFPRALMFPVPVNLSVDCLLPEDETVHPTRCSGPQAPEQAESATTANQRNSGQ